MRAPLTAQEYQVGGASAIGGSEAWRDDPRPGHVLESAGPHAFQRLSREIIEQIQDLCVCEYIIYVPEQLLVTTAVTSYAGRQPTRSKGAAHVRVVPLRKEEGAQSAYHNLLPRLELQKQCVGAPASRHRLQFGLVL
jgi:hypothetical protein